MPQSSDIVIRVLCRPPTLNRQSQSQSPGRIRNPNIQIRIHTISIEKRLDFLKKNHSPNNSELSSNGIIKNTGTVQVPVKCYKKQLKIRIRNIHLVTICSTGTGPELGIILIFFLLVMFFDNVNIPLVSPRISL